MQNQIPPIGVQSQGYPQQQAPVAPTNTTITGGGFTGEVTIVPDARANNLLVPSNRSDFGLVQNVVTQLDTRPLQVLIEVLIAEVRRDKSMSFGVDVPLGETDLSNTLGTKVTATTSGAGDAGLGDFALKVMKIAGIDLDATLRAVAGKNNVSIVSRPVVITANNQEAEIVVGSQRPFIQVSRALPTELAVRDQVVQYKDVGTKLQIIPTISADGYVMLQIAQEIDAATAEQQFDAPVISTRSVETRLLVKDGRTIVIGGLIDRQHEVIQSGIPVLSSIPWIGGLFGRAHRQRTQTELFLFLTPRVIRGDEDVDQMTREYQDQAKLPKQ